MNDETSKALSDLYSDMALAGYHKSGAYIDQIRLEMETHGYMSTHQHELGIILRNLQRRGAPTFAERLKKIVASLGSPQHT